MVDLPKVSQDFEADGSQYVAEIEAMIAANERFISSIEDAIGKIEEFRAALDSLPREKDIKIELNEDDVLEQVAYIRELLNGIPDHKNVTVTVEQMGGVGNLQEATQAPGGDPFAGMEESAAKLDQELKSVRADAAALDEQLAAFGRVSEPFAYTAEDVNKLNAALREAEPDGSAAAAAMAALAAAGRSAGSSLAAVGAAAKDADTATKTIAGAALASVAGFTAFGLSLTQLHWIFMGTIEAIATLLPAMIALGTGMLAGAEGATWIADKLQGVYTASEATSQMLGVTSGQALGLKSTLQQAQAAADPGVYELLGAALNGAKTSFFNFGAEGVQVIHMLDAFAAKIDVELAGAVGQQLHTMLGTGVSDLQAWGAVLGNIGHTVLNLSSEMPGLAEVLIHALSGVTGFLNMISGAAPALVTFGMGLEETWRWGGLVARVMGVAVSALGNFAGVVSKAAAGLALMGNTSKLTGIRTALLGVADGGAAAAGGLEGAAAVLAGPWGWVIAGAALGLGLLIDKMATAQDAAQRFSSTMETAVNKANFTQGLTDILTDLPILQERLNSASSAAAVASRSINTTGTAFAKAGPGVSQAAQDVGTYTTAINKLIAQAVNILTMNTKIDGSYYSLSEAMALAGAAGLTVGQAFNKQGQMTAVAKQQIANLVEGYKQMDQTGTTLSNDINAINEQMLMQQTKVQSLNQAWDGFIKNMTGVSSSVAGLYTDLTTIGNVTEVAKNKIRAFSQGAQGMSLNVQQVAQQLKSFGADSAQVWSNFDSAVGQGETAIDGLRTAAAAGGISNQQYTESIKGIVAQMLPYAQYSATATSELSALAQQAGGPATTNFGTLSKWVGNTKTATDGLNKTVQTATQYMSNLDKVASNLASTLDSAVAGAISQGAINIKGITAATQNFEAALHSSSGTINGQVVSSLRGMISQLSAAGESTHNQIAIIDQLASRAGVSAGQIQALNRAIQSLQSKTVTITTNFMTTGTNPYPGGISGRNATGGYIASGTNPTADDVPILVSKGEYVVKAASVDKYGKGMLDAINAGRFASGGSTNTANRAKAAAQDAAMLAKFFPIPPIPSPAPLPPQFMGEWLPSSMIGLSGGAGGDRFGGGTPTGSGGVTGSTPAGRQAAGGTTLEVEHPIQVHVKLDGRDVWQSEQKHTLRYNLRNNGVPTGLQKPR